MGNPGQCGPCFERHHRNHVARGRWRQARMAPTNFNPGVLRINRQIRDEILSAASPFVAAMNSYHTCMQSCMRLLLAVLPMDRKAAIRQLRFRHLWTRLPLQVPPRLEVFQGLKLSPESEILDLEIIENQIVNPRRTLSTTSSASASSSSPTSIRTDIILHWNIPREYGQDARAALEDEMCRSKPGGKKKAKQQPRDDGPGEGGGSNSRRASSASTQHLHQENFALTDPTTGESSISSTTSSTNNNPGPEQVFATPIVPPPPPLPNLATASDPANTGVRRRLAKLGKKALRGGGGGGGSTSTE